MYLNAGKRNADAVEVEEVEAAGAIQELETRTLLKGCPSEESVMAQRGHARKETYVEIRTPAAEQPLQFAHQIAPVGIVTVTLNATRPVPLSRTN